MDVKEAEETVELARRLRAEVIVNRLEKGETLMEIAADMGHPWQWVQRQARRAGYKVRERKAARKQQEAANVHETVDSI